MHIAAALSPTLSTRDAYSASVIKTNSAYCFLSACGVDFFLRFLGSSACSEASSAPALSSCLGGVVAPSLSNTGFSGNASSRREYKGSSRAAKLSDHTTLCFSHKSLSIASTSARVSSIFSPLSSSTFALARKYRHSFLSVKSADSVAFIPRNSSSLNQKA